MKKAQQQINAAEPSDKLNYNTLRKSLTEKYQLLIPTLKTILLAIFTYLYVSCTAAIYTVLFMRELIGGVAC